jgi:hypothetical protein
MFATADLMDIDDDSPQSCDLQFRDFGGVARFHLGCVMLIVL